MIQMSENIFGKLLHKIFILINFFLKLNFNKFLFSDKFFAEVSFNLI